MQKTLLTITLALAVCSSGIAQKKNKKEGAKPDSVAYYMSNDHDIAPGEQYARFLRLIIKADSGMFNIQDYYMDAKPRLVAKSFSDEADFRSGTQGLCTEYFANGNKKRETYFRKGLLIGDCTEYYSSGVLYTVKNYDRPDSVYLKKCQDSTGKVLADNGKGVWLKFDDSFGTDFLKGPIVNGNEDGEWKKYVHDGSVYTIIYKNGIVISGKEFVGGGENVFTAVEQAPSFIGGDVALGKYIGQSIRFPASERERETGFSGSVRITFIVEKDGSITDVKVIKSLSDEFDKEAIRVISTMPKWKPGIQNGMPVRVQYSIPVNFSMVVEK